MTHGTIPQTLWHELGILVLEYKTQDHFLVLGDLPQWFISGSDFRTKIEYINPGDLFPALDEFLRNEAPNVWLQNTNSHTALFGPWVQPSLNHNEWPLEAVATLVAGRKLLLIYFVEQHVQERRHVLQRARERALETEKLQLELAKREDFIHCLVHDLASPLASIESSLELVDAELKEGSQSLIRAARTELQRQQEIILQLLNIYHIHSGETFAGIFEKTVSCPLLSSIEAAIQLFAPMLKLQRLPLPVIESHVEENALVLAEPMALRRVIANFLENAFQHAFPKGVVRIRITSQEDYYQVEVIDQGAGVSQAMASKLFDRFSQERRAKGRRGVGLYFCSLCAKAWGGSVGYRSAKEEGTIFFISLKKDGIFRNPA